MYDKHRWEYSDPELCGLNIRRDEFKQINVQYKISKFKLCYR